MRLQTLIHNTVTTKQETLQKIVAVLNVRIDGETKSAVATSSLIPTGNHWVLFVIDMSSKSSYYADPLGYPVPYNFKIETDPFLHLLCEALDYTVDYPVQLMHKINFDSTGRHLCLGECLTYPVQTCSSICGFVTIMTSAIMAKCDLRVWECILSKRRSVNPLKKWLRIYLHPSEYPIIIRRAIANWIISGEITVGQITDKRLTIPDEITMVLQTSCKSTTEEMQEIGVPKIAKTAHLLKQLFPTSSHDRKQVYSLKASTNSTRKQFKEAIYTSSHLMQNETDDTHKLQTVSKKHATKQLHVKPSSQCLGHPIITTGLPSAAESTNKPALKSVPSFSAISCSTDSTSGDQRHMPDYKQLTVLTERKGRCTISTLRELLPAGFEHTVQSFTAYAPSQYCGAPDLFIADLLVDITDESSSIRWMEDFCKVSLTTYRTQRTYPKLKGKRLLYKVDYRCQHNTMNRKLKTTKRTGRTSSRDKDTACPSTITVAVLPSEQAIKGCQGQIKIDFRHNHPLSSAHVLSFRDVSCDTKKAFLDYFSQGYSPAQAKFVHENNLLVHTDDLTSEQHLSDRSTNPRLGDIYRLKSEWDQTNCGPRQGKAMFEEFEARIEQFNKDCGMSGGKAVLQRFNTSKLPGEQTPFILAVCTPLMCRVHKYVQQAGELVYCDATSGLDGCNCAMYVISCSNVAGGIPLGIVVTSSETIVTLSVALQKLQAVMPDWAFYNKGQRGPDTFMTDDASALREALAAQWPRARRLLCIFHLLQSIWRWLWNAKNNIPLQDRQCLMKAVKALVFAESEEVVMAKYEDLQLLDTYKQHPHFAKYFDATWHRRREWATSYRLGLLTRGNNTNNYAEVGFRIFKDIICQRTKAFNLIQLFQFITVNLEQYYELRLLNIGHSRFDRALSVRFYGWDGEKVDATAIAEVDGTMGLYSVPSTSNAQFYTVDINLGVCSCPKGMNGQPCHHQAAVVMKYKLYSINYVPYYSASARRQFATIARGDRVQNEEFYASLHEKATHSVLTRDSQGSKSDPTEAIFADKWHTLIENQHFNHYPDSENSAEIHDNNTESYEIVCSNLDYVVEDLKSRLTCDPQIKEAVGKFCEKYWTLKMSTTLASSLHQFGRPHFPPTRKSTIKRYRHNMIPVQPTATAHRRPLLSRGRRDAPQGRPKGSKRKAEVELDKSIMPKRGKLSLKKPHSLSKLMSQ